MMPCCSTSTGVALRRRRWRSRLGPKSTSFSAWRPGPGAWSFFARQREYSVVFGHPSQRYKRAIRSRPFLQQQAHTSRSHNNLANPPQHHPIVNHDVRPSPRHGHLHLPRTPRGRHSSAETLGHPHFHRHRHREAVPDAPARVVVLHRPCAVLQLCGERVRPRCEHHPRPARHRGPGRGCSRRPELLAHLRHRRRRRLLLCQRRVLPEQQCRRLDLHWLRPGDPLSKRTWRSRRS